MQLNTILLNQQAPNAGGIYQIGMIVLLIAIFYFLMIRPQNKKQKQIRKFREGLQSGDKVITAGGIYGKIKDIRENVILLEVSEGVKIKIDKGSVYPTAADASAQAPTKE